MIPVAKHLLIQKLIFKQNAALKQQSEKVLLLGKIAQLQHVADVAALCIIDLRANLKDAEAEYKDGTLSRGAYENVMVRYTVLHQALDKAGYTETHQFFDIPMRPATDQGGRHATGK